MIASTTEEVQMPREFDRSRYYGAPDPPPEGWSFRGGVVAGYRRTSPARRLVHALLHVAGVVVLTAGFAVLLDWSTAKALFVGTVAVGLQVVSVVTAALWSRTSTPDPPDDTAG
jgi:hypothetical protein